MAHRKRYVKSYQPKVRELPPLEPLVELRHPQMDKSLFVPEYLAIEARDTMGFTIIKYT